jgi:enamine deaminase RidA (YjgF/YER057c/UK114 family)
MYQVANDPNKPWRIYNDETVAEENVSPAVLSLFGDHRPPDTVVGVETLARPEYLIEVDAIAVIGG